MSSLFAGLLGSAAFMPHGYCLLWQPELLGLHAVSDLFIALAYFSIPATLVILARRRPEKEFVWIFTLFAAFIMLCGLTHVMGLATLWWPVYTAQGLVKLLTAIVSIATAIAIWKALPHLAALPSQEELRLVNAELQRRVEENARINAELVAVRDSLEEKVHERTRELEIANARIARSEDYFRRSYRRTPAIAFIARQDGEIIEVTDNWVLAMGYSRDEAIGMNINDLLTEESRATAQSMPWEVMFRDNDGLVSGIELSYRRRDDTVMEGDVAVIREVDTATDETIYLVLIVDVTERNRAQRKLEEQALNLMRANESLEQFAYVASHDLQEPLRKIVLYADMLTDGLAQGRTDDVTYAAQVVRDASLRARALVSDLLSYSRASNRKLDLGAYDFAMALGDARSTLSQLIEDSGAVIRLEGPSVTLFADRLLLDQVLLNLLSNSIKYARDKVPPQIDVTVGTRHRRKLCLTFADNGIGFREEYARKIFEPFTRLHGRSQYPGTGIGLAICRAVCDRHGWKISASGRPGEGAVFTIEIPRSSFAIAGETD
ncbi:sensor histidine kinase [Methylobrevis pamukkalensis]|uniref:histidine kinase n=1 Tax=Methylobrevis pamukkalensis TaxID=1439726 RepID=A0A1E3GZZ1_9HYPH|nr:ATP-binding protein [Methylobrevis pamukkalensis]ODN69633.1 Phytochrome-like protein cph1 [Methylobrevis pamukkalensis]